MCKKRSGFEQYEDHLKLKKLKIFLKSEISGLKKERGELDKKRKHFEQKDKGTLEAYQLIYLKTFGELKIKNNRKYYL